ncbi:MAG: hypothetical protein HOP16_06855 [Acidobacteria bacterium]|nr:hypothetical protein [Acidobacteriota bacterium]
MTHLSFVLAPIVLTGFTLTRHRRIAVLLAMCTVAMAYTVYIGGDTWERPYHASRFLAAITPLLICVALSLTRERVAQRHGSIAPVVVTVLGLLMATGLSGRSFRAWLRTDMDHNKLFGQVVLGEMLREQAAPDARIAVVWAGAAPYFSGLYTIDLLGKSDKFIARTPPHNMALGHNKWDNAHSIGELKPDYILELWDRSPESLAYVTGLGYSEMPNGIFVRSR